jgi:hypothetical protein
MTLGAVTYYALLLTPFLVQLVMLILQFGAYRKHGHISFLLLGVATTCGILFLALPLAYHWIYGEGWPAFLNWRVAAVLALLAQAILTVWGTTSLFRSYGRLAAAARCSAAVADAPNNRWRGP